MSYLWVLLGLLSAFLYAIVGVLEKLGASRIDTTIAAIFHSGLTLIIFTGMFFATNKIEMVKTVDSRGLLFLFFASLCTALSWGVYYVALRIGPASKIASLEQLSVVFLIYMAVFLGETLTWKSIFGSLLLLAGAIMVAL